MKRLIVTADDFGLSVPVNEAVEDAARRGILTATSLMVGAPAAEDAILRARRLPNLAVGLHLALIDAPPVLPASEIPDIVGEDGMLARDPFRAGANIYLRPAARRQAEAEVRAQFEAFRRTGLPLDHVNGHHHFHMHPTIFETIVRLAGEFGVRAVRVPDERPIRSWKAVGEGLGRRIASWLLNRGRTGAMKRRLKGAGIRYNESIIGVGDSGHMTRERVLKLLETVPEGTCEMYFHPATRPWSDSFAPPESYRSVEEYQALIDPEVSRAVKRLGLSLTNFAALGRSA